MRRRRFVQLTAALGVSATSGCGTLLHPERRGAPHSRDIDWKIVALDGLCLLLFFIPGVIAFVVDFSTGAIYLPCECCPPYGGPVPDGSSEEVISPGVPVTHQLRRQPLPVAGSPAESLQAVVQRETGRQVVLTAEDVRVSPLSALQGYHTQVARHRADRRFGTAAKEILGRLSLRRPQRPTDVSAPTART